MKIILNVEMGSFSIDNTSFSKKSMSGAHVEEFVKSLDPEKSANLYFKPPSTQIETPYAVMPGLT